MRGEIPMSTQRNLNVLGIHKFKIEKRVYYDNPSKYGIYATTPLDQAVPFVKNNYGNVTIKGVGDQLEYGDIVTFEITKVYEDRYGKSYLFDTPTIIEIDTIEQQELLLVSALGDKNARPILEAYPDSMIVDLLLEDKIDHKIIHGVGEKTIERYKEKVNDRLKESRVVKMFRDLGLSDSVIEKAKRQYSESIGYLEKKFNQNPYILAELERVSFTYLDERFNEVLVKPVDPVRINAGANHLFKKMAGDGHTVSNINSFVTECIKLLNVDTDVIESTLRKNEEYEIVENMIGRKRDVQTEREIVQIVNGLNKTYVKHDTVDNVKERLKKFQEENNINFTDEQQEAVIDGYNHGVTIINGKAGTGKSTVLKGLIEAYDMDYIAVAMSGKAVNVLRAKGITAQTIHSYVYQTEPKLRQAEIELEKMKENNPELSEIDKLDYEEKKLVILDEASMVDIYLFKRLISLSQKGSKFVIVGDTGQAPAIGSGDVLRDLLQSQMVKTYELTQIHRQAAENGIIDLASRIREGKNIPLSKGIYDFGKDGQGVKLKIVDSSEKASHEIVSIINYLSPELKEPKDFLYFQLMSPVTKNGINNVATINEYTQTSWNPSKINEKAVVVSGVRYKIGDKIITNGNNYEPLKAATIGELKDLIDERREEEVRKKELEELAKDSKAERLNKEMNKDKEINMDAALYNGTVGIIVDIYDGLILASFEGKNGFYLVEVRYNSNSNPEELKEDVSFNLAYCSTVHKMQGSSAKNVVFVMDTGSFFMASRQIVYTALTRAESQAIIIAEEKTWRKAMNTDASGLRVTTMQQWTKEDYLSNLDHNQIFKELRKKRIGRTISNYDF